MPLALNRNIGRCPSCRELYALNDADELPKHRIITEPFLPFSAYPECPGGGETVSKEEKKKGRKK